MTASSSTKDSLPTRRLTRSAHKLDKDHQKEMNNVSPSPAVVAIPFNVSTVQEEQQKKELQPVNEEEEGSVKQVSLSGSEDEDDQLSNKTSNDNNNEEDEEEEVTCFNLNQGNNNPPAAATTTTTNNNNNNNNNNGGKKINWDDKVELTGEQDEEFFDIMAPFRKEDDGTFKKGRITNQDLYEMKAALLESCHFSGGGHMTDNFVRNNWNRLHKKHCYKNLPPEKKNKRQAKNTSSQRERRKKAKLTTATAASRKLVKLTGSNKHVALRLQLLAKVAETDPKLALASADMHELHMAQLDTMKQQSSDCRLMHRPDKK